MIGYWISLGICLLAVLPALAALVCSAGCHKPAYHLHMWCPDQPHVGPHDGLEIKVWPDDDADPQLPDGHNGKLWFMAHEVTVDLG